MSLLENATLSAAGVSYYALAGSQIEIPGPPGPPGPQGEPGIQGLPGNSILSDVVPPTAAVGNVDDLFVDLVTSQLYKKTDAVTWTPEFGLIGAAGTPATAAVGLTVTVAAGQPANVTNTGPNPSNAIFNFAIPAGAAATVAAGPVTTLAPGAPATVVNTGTTSAAVFAFGIPQGEPGSSSEATWSNYPAISGVDMASFSITNAVGMTAPLATDLTLNAQSVVVKGGALDIDSNDLKNVGSVSTSGAGNTVDFGSVVPPDAPLARFSVLSSEVNVTHLDPLSQMTIRGQGDVRVESTAGDLNLIGDDVNIATTGSTNILNITSLAGIQNTAGGFFNVTAGGAMAVQAGGLISITTPGQINIGSGNEFGATTSIEKLDILDSVVSKVDGAADLEFENVKKISNAGDITRELLIEASDAPLTLQGTQTNLTSRSNGNVIIGAQGTGTTRIGTGTAVDVVVVDAAGKTTFSVVPQCAAPPVAGPDLVNLTYADTKLPADAVATLQFDLIAEAIDETTTGPFLYVPSATNAPTGIPALVAGAVPLFVQTGGSAKLWAYFNGAWNAI